PLVSLVVGFDRAAPTRIAQASSSGRARALTPRPEAWYTRCRRSCIAEILPASPGTPGCLKTAGCGKPGRVTRDSYSEGRAAWEPPPRLVLNASLIADARRTLYYIRI